MGCTEKVVIVGAGISGLACAFRLRQLGCPCLVLEAQGRVGGVIASVRRNGFVFELGPQFPRFPNPLWHLVCELGLEREFLVGNPKAKRYIFHRDTLHPGVFSPGALLATRLVSTASKLRILTEVFGSTEPPPQEESVAEFVERKFGKDVAENLVDPIVSTVFFGDARKMGMEGAFPALVGWERKHGSVARGALRARNSKSARSSSLKVTDALPSLGSFQNGMGSLPVALLGNLPDAVKCKAQVVTLALAKGEATGMHDAWQIILANGETRRASHVVLAVPAYEAARLLEIASPELAQRLGAIDYAPTCVVSTAYNGSQITHPLDRKISTPFAPSGTLRCFRNTHQLGKSCSLVSRAGNCARVPTIPMTILTSAPSLLKMPRSWESPAPPSTRKFGDTRPPCRNTMLDTQGA